MKKIERPFRVSEAVVRGVALQVFLLSLTALLTSHIIPLYIIAVDFTIRVFLVPSFSPLVLISRWIIVPLVKFKKKQIIFQPKRFAAMIGLSLSLASLLSSYGNKAGLVFVLLLLLGTFSALETFFRFCARCKIFGLLMKLGWVDEELCTDCVFNNGGGI